jgi:hypothetical protein
VARNVEQLEGRKKMEALAKQEEEQEGEEQEEEVEEEAEEV